MALKRDGKKSTMEAAPLPVTILSGFLGSGKTTLLKHILQSETHGLRFAIIVNDMGAINADATRIARLPSESPAAGKQKIVRFRNGCICCTLRGDLLTELARLACSGDFDYVIIESSGISEPQQVAEAFTLGLGEAILEMPEGGFREKEREIIWRIVQLGGLEKLAKIDTMVTVVDAFRFFNEFDTAKTLADRWGEDKVPEENERTVTQLFVGQIEFANVVIINKVDMVKEEALGRVRAIVRALNAKAKIIETRYSRIDPKLILGTGTFSIAAALDSSGWLASLKEMKPTRVKGAKKLTSVPETLEYGINSFVYRARRPFDPKKLFVVLRPFFIVRRAVPEGNEVRSEGDEGESDGETLDILEFSDEAVLANKRAHPVWKRVYRSKGLFWLATRPRRSGAWSTAGVVMETQYEDDWFCCWPNESWRKIYEIKPEEDFEGEWGDRRQEIVFIGEKMVSEEVGKILDGCLLNDREMSSWESIMRKKWDWEHKEEVLCQKWDDRPWALWEPAGFNIDESLEEELREWVQEGNQRDEEEDEGTEGQEDEWEDEDEDEEIEADANVNTLPRKAGGTSQTLGPRPRYKKVNSKIQRRTHLRKDSGYNKRA